MNKNLDIVINKLLLEFKDFNPLYSRIPDSSPMYYLSITNKILLFIAGFDIGNDEYIHLITICKKHNINLNIKEQNGLDCMAMGSDGDIGDLLEFNLHNSDYTNIDYLILSIKMEVIKIINDT